MPKLNEARTRKELIDPALKKAGWDVMDTKKVGIEIPVDDFDPTAWQALQKELAVKEAGVSYEVALPAGISDYVLYRHNGDILAIVEAKKTSIAPNLAKTQTQFYVEHIEKRQGFKPFAFMTNGEEIRFWDIGIANDRVVTGFFSEDDLERMLALRTERKPLSSIPINPAITDRVYQQEAIKRVIEAFENENKRKALLVMATGTGKTRTSMSLIDVFMRGNQARNILFVADRRALVAQAMDDGFKTYFPNEPVGHIVTGNIDKTKRLYVVGLKTLATCFEQFSPAFFDLIIFDEVHRSIFNQYRKPIEYFDGRLIGLTATPAGFIDRNTFLTFDCTDEKPTALYTYEEGVKEDYLADYALYSASTGFQLEGIKGWQLSEEAKNQLFEQGLELDDINYEGSDLEKKVSNTDTIRKQWQEFWEVCYRDDSGLPCKTIVFALTQAHALRLADVFQELYPQYPDLVQVITYTSNYKGNAIRTFKKKSSPRIAITVDMLSTGVDVPEVMNLVFMKPVRSQIQLWQMIGRGTRHQKTVKHPEWLPNGEKIDFKIIDFWQNEFGKDPNEAVDNNSTPVLVRLFNTRVKLLEALARESEDYVATRQLVRDMIAQIPTDSFTIRRVWHEVKQAWEDGFWLYLNQNKFDFLRLKIAPLLREVPNIDVEATTFTNKVERLKHQITTGKETEQVAVSIAEDAGRLEDSILQTEPQRKARDFAISHNLPNATLAQLTELEQTLAQLMRQRSEKVSSFITLDLADEIKRRSYIFLKDTPTPMYVEEYQKAVKKRVNEVIDSHPAIEVIGRGDTPTHEQLIDLERTLVVELGDSLELTRENVKRAYGWEVDSLIAFVRELLDIDEIPNYADIVENKFQTFAKERTLNADQLRFLRALQGVFLQRRKLTMTDFYTAKAVKAFGRNAADRLFSESVREEIIILTREIA